MMGCSLTVMVIVWEEELDEPDVLVWFSPTPAPTPTPTVLFADTTSPPIVMGLIMPGCTNSVADTDDVADAET